jgi:putative membrane protein
MASLDQRDHMKIHAATEAVRSKTAARFEVMAVPVSDRYALWPVAYGAFAALVVGGIVALATALSLRDGFGIEAAVFVVVSLILEWPPFKLMLVPRRLKHERARQFAHRAFAARILAAKDRKTGMVLFVSLGERYIELVTDDALDRVIGQTTWNRIVGDFTSAVRTVGVSEALTSAIDRCGLELAKHFPKS